MKNKLFKALLGSKSKVVINGQTFVGDNIVVDGGGTVIIDGVIQGGPIVGPINVSVEGDVRDLTTVSGDVSVTGSCGSISTTSGDIECGDVTGSVTTVSGDVECGSVGGNVKTVSGDIRSS